MLPPAVRPNPTPIGPGLLLRALGSGWLSPSELARLAALYLDLEKVVSGQWSVLSQDDEGDDDEGEDDDEGYEEAEAA